MRKRLKLLVTGLLVGGLAFVASTGSLLSSPDLRESADLALFDPGNIITDGVFYDTSTMNVERIQRFLQDKGRNCSGSNCLKNFRQDTWTRSADTRCGAYQGATQETAAQIIWKVAQACGINPQALLVTLQKEQGLITSSGPSDGKLRIAMGYGCPDTAACDTQYYGFYNQVYSAARQFKHYRANPGRYSYRAGLTNSIGYQVAPGDPARFNYQDRDCGRASVYIQNQATAGLYNYTPYTPNRAALSAGYGTGDVCSAYGNRNFYNYFTDWFGSTQSSGGSEVLEKYDALRAAGVDIGAPTSDVTCDLPNDGCRRTYTGGHLYWSRGTGAHVVRGAILDRYLHLGGPAALGYPTGDDTAAPWGTGFFTDFQGGSIYWSAATEAYEVRGAILDKWRERGAQAGALGYPTSGDTPAPGGGFTTAFEGGQVFWSAATGAKVVRGGVLAAYKAAGGPAALGYPTGDDGVTADGRGYMTPFQGGEIHWSAQTGAHVVRGAILEAWKKAGGSAGYLGFPTSSDAAAGRGGFVVDFQHGSFYWSAATGAKVVRGGILAAYKAAGGPAALGYPTGDDGVTADGRGYMTPFQGGEIHWSAQTGAHVVRGAILEAWKKAGGSAGYLGFPTSSDAAAGRGGFVVDFQHGSFYWSAATGAKVVRGGILAAYKAAGGPAALGYPTGDDGVTADGRGYMTPFQGGEIHWSAQTGAHVVRGAILEAWKKAGGSAGYLGFPTSSDAAAGRGGFVVDFQHGSFYWSAATGAKVVRGGILAAYKAAGGPAALGYPTGDDGVTADGRGYMTPFQGGEIHWSAQTGAHVVRGAILEAWKKAGGSAGYLGFPTSSDAAAPGGQGYLTSFQGGTIYWSAATQARVLRTELNAAYLAEGGTTGRLGYPVSDTRLTGGKQQADFQYGTLTTQ
ncbi:hypothetical protein ABC795_14450 [Blastococcus sp. HT6-30]|uniref:LGFP repeat-containing protein n=1 Tax=Blastococcus sp. HT6-30 TaxID=3144843 RepID=UPI00321A7688